MNSVRQWQVDMCVHRPQHADGAYREFAQMGQACTVVAAGEIFFSCRRAESKGEQA
jgi:hypothetical protein